MYYDKTLSLINEIKREQVLLCINIVSKYKFVKRLIVFGSSLTDECTDESDLDICLDMKSDISGLELYDLYVELRQVCNHCCDILKYHKLKGKIKDEIQNKGVVVYVIKNS